MSFFLMQRKIISDAVKNNFECNRNIFWMQRNMNGLI